MANLQRLLTRRPRIDKAEVEDVRERTMARFASLNEGNGTAETSGTAESVAASGSGLADGSETPATVGNAHVAPEAASPEAASPADATPTGPRIIVPRTIALGPPQAPVDAPEAHHTPPIIVLGAPEPVAPTAEAESAVIQLGPATVPVTEAGVTEADVVEADVVEPPSAAVAPVVAKTPKPKKMSKPKAATPRAATPKAAAATRRASKARTTRPAVAIPVIAEPRPVIDPGAVWPGQWPKDIALSDAAKGDSTSGSRVVVAPGDPPNRPPRLSFVGAHREDRGATNAEPVAVLAAQGPPIAVADTAPEPAGVAEPVAIADPPVAPSTPSLVAADPSVVVEPVAVGSTTTPSVRTARPPARRRPAPKPAAKAPKPVAKVVVARSPVQAAPAPVAAAFCPYCALALEPPPTASRRCTRCKQRIVVKRVQGRVVYLTEAAVEVFESERLRSANFGRWSKERSQWLKLARSVRADAGRIERLASAPLSDKVVASSKALYTTTAERQYREAKREDRWEDASRLKRDQAAAMHRLAGAPATPTADVLAMHREAISTELRGIGKMAKEATLVGSDGCDACRADDGLTFKIAAELRTPRLPHDGCPKGLCHCRWELTIRDRDMVERYLRRTVRASKTKRPTA